uniref:Glycine cleavage system H protein n=1 Tax=uncultured verrucomicrobium HF0130_25O04 TaxID=723596 RepID=E7C335_9BACT|nr:glycine cleavage system H protein (lipoate-binding) [uncultured verrucomicrobium HF0130_25O04]
MSEVPDDLLYTRDHEWLKKEDGGTFVIGITHHAQESLGDVTFVELPAVGQSFECNAVFGVIESVKAASDLFMPVTGEVIEINQNLNDFPERVNEDPYQQGWMIKIKPETDTSAEDLLNASAYAAEIS